MSQISRRTILGGAIAVGAAAAADAARAETGSVSLSAIKKEAEVACIYHADFGDPARFNQVLNNIGHHYEAAGSNPLDIQIVIVAHSGAVKFFLSDLKGSPWEKEGPFDREFDRVKGLSADGLRVYLCATTFRMLKLDREKARPGNFIRFVPSGVAAVAALQAKGFGYLKIG